MPPIGPLEKGSGCPSAKDPGPKAEVLTVRRLRCARRRPTRAACHGPTSAEGFDEEEVETAGEGASDLF